MEPHPNVYGVPHDEWRYGQWESVQWSLQKSAGTDILQQPTGSGKTAFATALGREKRVIGLCSTRTLQRQYADIYNWTLLQGKSHYPCVHTNAKPDSYADECLYPGKANKCPKYEDCPYYTAKSIAQRSQRAILNYHVWLSSLHWIHEDENFCAVMDEAHLLSNIVLDWVGITITEREIREWHLPKFPVIIDVDGLDLFGSEADPVMDAIDWLDQCKERLTSIWASLKNRGLDTGDNRKVFSKCENMMRNVSATLTALQRSENDWYISSGPNAINGSYPGFVAKPLTARYHFPNLFLFPKKTVLMSATIGNPDVMAAELGIKMHRYRSVPSVWPPESRPVYLLKDCPSMGYGATQKDPNAFNKQAELIANFIKEYPNDWPGMILVTRRSEASFLASRLAQNGLQDRVWPFPEVGTDEQVKQWSRRKNRHPNSIGISWSTWEGFDGVEEKILVVAKTPFPNVGSPGSYENRRMKFDPKYYRLRAALQIEQGCGRIRRGRPEDYDSYGKAAKAVAIADGSFKMIKGYLSDSFRESIVER